MVSSDPMPSQLVPDNVTVATAGSQTRPMTSRSGTTTMSAITTRSVADSRCSRRRPRPPLGVAAAGDDASPSDLVRGWADTGSVPFRASGGEDGLLLILDAVDEPVDVLRVL